jgi:mannose-1-phosphate guanylyltransferase
MNAVTLEIINAIVLAGGGTRLTSLTRKITGQETPKQFAQLLDEQTLFDQTNHRSARSSPKVAGCLM